MPKRRVQRKNLAANHTHSNELSSEDEECDQHVDDKETTAKNLIERQKETQKRRRTASGGRGSSTKTSVWSTVAASVSTKEGHASFCSSICGHIGSLNRHMSTSNIIDHYTTNHIATKRKLLALSSSNATPSAFKMEISAANARWKRRNQRQSIHNFLSGPSQTHESVETGIAEPPLESKLLQSVATVLFACATETALSKMGSPFLQGLIDAFGGRAKFASKTPLDRCLLDTYNAVCSLLRTSVNEAKTGSLTVDGWSAALGAPILGITWHFIDGDWKMRSVPISTLKIGQASKNGEQLRAIMEQVLQQNTAVGGDDVHVFTATSDNEAATALAVDLLTNYFGSVRCVVHTIALAVHDIFEEGAKWQKFMNHVNKVTTYFNHHPKASQLLIRKQLDEGVTNDRLQKLKHDIPTRWHSRLGAMLTYLTRIDTVSAVSDDLGIDTEALPHLSTEQQNTMAEFIFVLAEVRRVARQLEADRKVTISRAPRLLRELHETLLIMSQHMQPHPSEGTDTEPIGNDLDDSNDGAWSTALPSRPSCATADLEHDEARKIQLKKHHARSLALALAQRIEFRLGSLWQRVDENAATCPVG